MIAIEDGNIRILTVEENLDTAYAAFAEKYDNVSRSQFDGSKEYEVAYMLAQMDNTNAQAVAQALETTLNNAFLISEKFSLPDILQSRFKTVMREAGFIASQKNPADSGTMKVAISRTKVDGTTIDTDHGSQDYLDIVNLLGGVLLPSGIRSSMDALGPYPEWGIYTSGNTNIDLKWTWGATSDEQLAIYFRVTLRSKSTPPVGYESIIRGIMQENWQDLNEIGGEITPQLYLPISSVEWAKYVLIEHSLQAKDYDITTITDWSSSTRTINYYTDLFFSPTADYINIVLDDA